MGNHVKSNSSVNNTRFVFLGGELKHFGRYFILGMCVSFHGTQGNGGQCLRRRGRLQGASS